MKKEKIEIIKSDITKLTVDAIVNSANKSLLAGSGMCGAIHRQAGKELENECKIIGKCDEGKAVVTKGYKLPCKYVIHTVAPKWYLNTENKEELLRSCYRESLRLAVKNGVKILAFPSIGTGIYKTPIDIGAEIAINEISHFLCENNSLEKVIFVCFNDSDLAIYNEKYRCCF